jgi:general secretion pathway protein D
LHDGETQILAGLITDSDTSTVNKVPLLGQIPILGHLFANDTGNKTKTEIILSITPHIVGNKKIPDAREMEYWSGTDADLRSGQLVLKPFGEVSLTSSSPGYATSPASPSPSAAALAPAQRATTPTAPIVPTTAPTTPAVTPPPKPAVTSPAAAAAKPTSAAPDTNSGSDNAVANGPSDYSWQGPAKAKVGDKISLVLNTQTLQGVKALKIHVDFDPSVLKAVDVVEGNSMKQNNTASSLSKVIDPAAGDVAVDLTGSGTTKAGSIFTLIFEVIDSAQETTVSVSSIGGSMTNGEAYSQNLPPAFAVTVPQ